MAPSSSFTKATFYAHPPSPHLVFDTSAKSTDGVLPESHHVSIRVQDAAAALELSPGFGRSSVQQEQANGMSPYLRLLPMLLGIGSPGTLPKVFLDTLSAKIIRLTKHAMTITTAASATCFTPSPQNSATKPQDRNRKSQTPDPTA